MEKDIEFDFNSLAHVVQEAENKLEYIVYGDTDSLFINLEKLFTREYSSKNNMDYNLAREELSRYATLDVENKLDSDTVESLISLGKEISDNLNVVVSSFIENFAKKFNVPHKPTIEFEFEYLASRYFPIAGKTYIAKELGEDSIIQKKNGVKKSDPKLTKELLQEFFIIILKKASLKEIAIFIHEWAIKFMQAAKQFDWQVGIPITINKSFSDYATLGKHIKSAFNWNALVYYLEQRKGFSKLPKFEPGSRGFMFDVKPNGFIKDPVLVEYVRQYYKHIKEKLNPKVNFSKNELTHITIPFEAYQNDELMDFVRKTFQVELNELFRLAFCSYLNRMLKFEIKPTTLYTLTKYDKEQLEKMDDTELFKLLRSG